jgi:hypothetical protein
LLLVKKYVSTRGNSYFLNQKFKNIFMFFTIFIKSLCLFLFIGVALSLWERHDVPPSLREKLSSNSDPPSISEVEAARSNTVDLDISPRDSCVYDAVTIRWKPVVDEEVASSEMQLGIFDMLSPEVIWITPLHPIVASSSSTDWPPPVTKDSVYRGSIQCQQLDRVDCEHWWSIGGGLCTAGAGHHRRIR